MSNKFKKTILRGFREDTSESGDIKNSCTKLLVKETKNILEFLHDNFSEQNIGQDKIFEFLDYILNIESNETIKTKTFKIVLDYLKLEYFYSGKKISNKLFEYLNHENAKLIFGEYNNKTVIAIHEKHVDPYKEISYLLFLHGIGQEYNIISDIKKDELKGINGLLDEKLQNISAELTESSIDSYCQILNIINQLTIVLSINAEEKIIGYKLFNNILIKKTQSAIEKYLITINKDLVDIFSEDKNTDYSMEAEGKISEHEISNLNKLQDLLGKFYGNFSSNLENTQFTENVSITDNDELIKVVYFKFSEVIKKLNYGYSLRETAKFGNKSGNELEKAKNIAKLTTEGNIAFADILMIKKLEIIGVKESNYEELEKESMATLLNMYNASIGKESKFSSEEGVLEHFISQENTTYNQLIIVYKLILLGKVDVLLMQRVLKYMISKNINANSLYKKLEIKTLELILEKLYEKLFICDDIGCNKDFCKESINKICNKTIRLIENYIKNSDKDNLIYNFGRLYLSLSKIYSEGTTLETVNKAKNYLITFQEKYGYYLPSEFQELTQKLSFDIFKRERELINMNKSFEISRHDYLLKENHDIEDQIFKLIHEIQENKLGNSGNKVEKIQKNICKLINESIFNGLCNITIEPKNRYRKKGLLESLSIIEGDYNDIVFRYDSLYEDTFIHIFNRVKTYIKERVLHLIDINRDYMEKDQKFSTIVELACEIMEYKDSYTKGHVSIVKDLSAIIGKLLGLNEIELNMLVTKAMVHDYGKMSTPDELMKKTGKLSDEEKSIINSHTGNGIIQGINNNWDIDALDGMSHHCQFYGPNGDKSLTFQGLVGQIKKGKKVQPNAFNKFMGYNIPLASRIIMIPDIIDAISSRRVYDQRSGWDINKIISFIDQELLKGGGLKINGSKVEIDGNYWKIAGKEDLKLPYLVKFGDKLFKPQEDAVIYFDPLIIKEIFENKEAHKMIKRKIIKNDKEHIIQKVREFTDFINNLSSRKEKREVLINLVNGNMKEELLKMIDLEFSQEDESELNRLSDLLKKILEIKSSYRIKD